MIKLIKSCLGGFKCPDCGSTNTEQSTYADWCNDCGYNQGYFKKLIKRFI
jgi:predicted nucleic-acid-binding Zn-ribbon protein